jgi:hypothetical protein
MRPGFAKGSPSTKEGAGNAGCVLHPQTRVQKCTKSAHESNRYRRSNPAFPAQWFYGLCRALPGDEFVLSPSLADQGLAEPGWARKTSASLAPATGVGTTRFCRTRDTSFVLRAAGSLTSLARPATAIRADALASTASRPAFVTTRDPPLLSERDGAERAIDLRRGKAKYFPERGLDDPNHFERLE